MMSNFEKLLHAHNEALRAKHRFRTLHGSDPAGLGKVRRARRELLNFSGNDYLGLSSHPALIERAIAAAETWGVGSGASRLVSGTLTLHEKIEAKLARLKNTEAALIFASGYQANATILPALLRRELHGHEPIVFADELVHNSIHQGCRGAGVLPVFFPHNDLDALESRLKEDAKRPGARFILTESLFSMDGDRTDVAALADLADRYGAFLYLDEAHATGVLGPRGMGLAGEAPGRVPLIMGTFSKALGSFGAYVACSRALRDYLINRCGGFIYSTALPPPVLGAIDAALDLVPTLDEARMRLKGAGKRVRTAFRDAGIDTGLSTTHIVPAILGEETAALAMSRELERVGILGVAIRPPTVPPHTSRIRFSLSAAHSSKDIEQLIAATVEAVSTFRAVSGD